MKQSKKIFHHESIQDVESIRDILASITEGIGKSKLVFSDEDDKIEMRPLGLINLRVKASQDELSQRINIRIGWQIEDKPLKKKSLNIS